MRRGWTRSGRSSRGNRLDILALFRESGRWVPPTGHPRGRIAFVAEAPGKEEVRLGYPLVGPSGVINWQFAAIYGGLHQAGAYVTNWRKVPFSEREKKDITQEEVDAWTELLEKELAEVKPEVVIALGAYAVRALLGEGYSLFWSNGVAFNRGDFVVIPVVHPAAGMHKEAMLPMTAQGYSGTRRFFAGESPARNIGQWNAAPKTSSGVATFTYPSIGIPMAVDTEGLAGNPYCITFSFQSDQAWIVYAGDKEELARWRAYVEKYRPTLILHNAVHDASVIRAMTGLNIWDFTVIDTMVLAFVLQDLPRGLKDLTKRELNIFMEEFEEVVRPYHEAAEAAWKNRGYIAAIDACREEVQYTPKTGKVRMKKGQPVIKRICPEIEGGIVRHLELRQNLAPQEVAWIEQRFGARPNIYDLRLAPKEVAEAYAGKDAAVTLGVSGPLKTRMTAEGLSDVASLDMSVLPMIEDFEQVGMHVDLERYWTVMGDRKSVV